MAFHIYRLYWGSWETALFTLCDIGFSDRNEIPDIAAAKSLAHFTYSKLPRKQTSMFQGRLWHVGRNVWEEDTPVLNKRACPCVPFFFPGWFSLAKHEPVGAVGLFLRKWFLTFLSSRWALLFRLRRRCWEVSRGSPGHRVSKLSAGWQQGPAAEVLLTASVNAIDQSVLRWWEVIG